MADSALVISLVLFTAAFLLFWQKNFAQQGFKFFKH
jgi:hypothetical protein